MNTHTDDFERLTGHVPPWHPDPGEGLDSAWTRCPDARWMLAMAIEGGAHPRAVTRAMVACIRVLLPDLDDTPPWRGLLHVAECYGRGEMESEALRQLMPEPLPHPVDPQHVTKAQVEWSAAVRRLVQQYFETRAPVFTQIATGAMQRALHPDTSARNRVRDASRMVDALAMLRGMHARGGAREAAEDMLTEHRLSQAPGVAMMLPPLESPAWDEAAQAGYRHALEQCAVRVRDLVPKPW